MRNAGSARSSVKKSSEPPPPPPPELACGITRTATVTTADADRVGSSVATAVTVTVAGVGALAGAVCHAGRRDRADCRIAARDAVDLPAHRCVDGVRDHGSEGLVRSDEHGRRGR